MEVIKQNQAEIFQQEKKARSEIKNMKECIGINRRTDQTEESVNSMTNYLRTHYCRRKEKESTE